MLNEIKPSAYFEPEDTLARCYRLRTLTRFAEWFGLVEAEKSTDPLARISSFTLRKSKFLDQVVSWV